MNCSKTFNSILTAGILLVFASVLMCLSGCREQSVSVADSKPPIAVNVFQLKQVDTTVQTATYFGELSPNRSRTIGFAVPGTIKFIAKIGQIVASNDPLVELKVEELREKRESLQSQLEGTQEPPQIQQLQAQLAELDAQIEASRILAPFDCVVVESFVNENSLVAARSPALRVIESTDPRIKINLPSKVASLIQENIDVYFLIDDQVVIGNLSEKSEIEKAGSQFCWFSIKSDLSNINYRLGQTVEARFNFQTSNSGFWIPLSALDRSDEGIWSLLLVESSDGESIVTQKLVTIVQLEDERALISGDLVDESVAIADGTHRIVPGQEVEPKLIANPAEIADGESVQ